MKRDIISCSNKIATLTGDIPSNYQKDKTTLFHNLILTLPYKQLFENIIRKGENAGNQHFLLFPRFLPD